MHTLGAFAIIRDTQGKVLLCHRTDRDAWDLPGGRAESNEPPWDVVTREVEEEVGLRVKPEVLTGVYWVPSRSDLVFTFLCTVVSGELRKSDEADEVRWYLPSELPANTSRRHAERIQDSLGQHRGVMLKEQN
jgi:ADP-ribose pyrophosphatase YjhB (NUDIX family)